jgi:hypothetical protein
MAQEVCHATVRIAAGDRIGCGVDATLGLAYLTHNGLLLRKALVPLVRLQPLGASAVLAAPSARLRPAVTISGKVGLARIVVLYHRSPTLYQIYEEVRCHYF